MLDDYRLQYHDIERAFRLFILHVEYLATRELHYKLRTQISTVYHKKKKFVSKKKAKLLVPLVLLCLPIEEKENLRGECCKIHLHLYFSN